MKRLDNCPKCGVSLIGDPIPEDIVEHYAGTHWRREIGIEVRGVYDGVLFWRCPDCEHEWDRFTGKLGKDMKRRYEERLNKDE